MTKKESFVIQGNMEQIEQNLTERITSRVAEKKSKKEKEGARRGKDYFTKIILKDEGTREDFAPDRRKGYVEEGVEFLVDARDKGVQTMVFMDKSARPLAGFFRALWRRLWPEETPPEMKFMVGSTGKWSSYTAEDVARAFAPARDAFNGKIVLLVDEVVEQGFTLRNARTRLKKAFPGAMILTGAMAGTLSSKLDLDINIPESSGAYYACSRGLLGNNLYNRTKEVKEIVDLSGRPMNVFVKARRGHSAKETYSYILRQVGKYETLGEESIDAMDKKIAAEDMAKKYRLLKIREAYEKLME